jgi:hypothetical protein
MDIVSGWRVKRRDPMFRRLGSWLANWSVRKLGGVKLKDFGCSLRAYRGDFLDQLDFGIHRLYDKAAALSLTDAITDVPVRHFPSTGSGWTLINLVRYWVDNLITFGDQFFIRIGYWAAGSIFLAVLITVLSLLGVELTSFTVPLILLGFALIMGLLALVGVAATRAIREAQRQNCYLIRTRLLRRWRQEERL